MNKSDYAEYTDRMQKTLDVMLTNFAAVRAGRAGITSHRVTFAIKLGSCRSRSAICITFICVEILSPVRPTAGLSRRPGRNPGSSPSIKPSRKNCKR